MLLSDFHSIRPPYETTQKETLDWLTSAHAMAEALVSKGSASEMEEFKQKLEEKLWHVGCKPDRIAKRGHVVEDYLHQNWNEMEIYRLLENPSGSDLTTRMKHYQESADLILESYYPEGSLPPDDLIHISCTGYVSPSPAQKLVAKRDWGMMTTVTHAYHMGCYGAFPGIRMGQGFLASGKNQVDLVHTELCSLHTNPSLHRLDQLVSQSLFADGFMKYSMSKTTDKPNLCLLSLHEEIIPRSTHAMTWNIQSWGFEMTLSKEVPVLIARSLRGYLERLCRKAGRDVDEVIKNSFFAIHPGGPKILLHIQELLSLSDQQMAYSFEILKQYGNMSSATLPHIWQAILSDGQEKSEIVSMAFGPGLTISGSLMEVGSCG